MVLKLDVITLGAPEVQAARTFYATAFSPTITGDDSVSLDMHGTARIALSATERLAADVGAKPVASGFRGYLLTYIVNQPTEVKTLMDAAVRSGAEVLKAREEGPLRFVLRGVPGTGRRHLEALENRRPLQCRS